MATAAAAAVAAAEAPVANLLTSSGLIPPGRPGDRQGQEVIPQAGRHQSSDPDSPGDSPRAASAASRRGRQSLWGVQIVCRYYNYNYYLFIFRIGWLSPAKYFI